VDDAKLLRRGGDLQRSLTLLRVFLLASALICAGAGVALGSILSRSLKSEALNAEETALARYVDGVVHPLLVRNGHVHIPWKQDGRLAQSVLRQRDIATVKVWEEGRNPRLDEHALPVEHRPARAESRSAPDRPSLPAR
jgi:hypothetical protein